MKDQLHLTRETILQSFMKIWRKGNIWAKLFFIQFHGRAIVTICEGLIRTFYTSLHSHNSIVTWDEPWVDQRQTRTKVRAGRGEQYHHRGPQISPWIKMILTNPFLKNEGWFAENLHFKETEWRVHSTLRCWIACWSESSGSRCSIIPLLIVPRVAAFIGESRCR